MAYDDVLADRVRELFLGDPDVAEKKMFGGLAFLLGGHMAVAVSREGGLLLRVDPARCDKLLDTTTARPMVMRGRELHGWLRVDADAVKTKRQLTKWVDLASTHARSLPAKKRSSTKPR